MSDGRHYKRKDIENLAIGDFVFDGFARVRVKDLSATYVAQAGSNAGKLWRLVTTEENDKFTIIEGDTKRPPHSVER